METIKITNENRQTILELFGLNKSKGGWIVYEKTGNSLECPYCHKAVNYKDFAVLPATNTFNVFKPKGVVTHNNHLCIASHMEENPEIKW